MRVIRVRDMELKSLHEGKEGDLIGVIQPQAKEGLTLPETGEMQEGFFLRAFRRSAALPVL